jgi:hypothetical protein
MVDCAKKNMAKELVYVYKCIHTYNISCMQGMVDCAKQTMAKEGVKGLYRGMAAPIAGSNSYIHTCTEEWSPP